MCVFAFSCSFICLFVSAAVGDEDDAFDCNVDVEALAKIGRSLGLQFSPQTSAEPDVNSEIDGNEDLRKIGAANGGISAQGDSERWEDGAEGYRGMGEEDLVWWLLMFPFFDKEFDMVEVVASSVFGGDEGSNEDSEDDEDGVEDGGGGGESGSGDSDNGGRRSNNVMLVKGKAMMVEGSE